jgi:isopentenyl-diphosphate delta-isomerase
MLKTLRTEVFLFVIIKAMAESIIFVDENDIPIGLGTREEAWSKGIHVRIVRAILRDENGRVLSQHRSPNKKSYPNRWTDSASGHVDEGDTYDTAITREMKEEVNVNTELTFLGKFASRDVIGDKTILEFNAIYEGSVDSSIEFNLQDSEVSEVKWFEIDELKQMMKKEPDLFTPGFRETIARFY